MKKEIRFYLTAHDVRETFKKFDIEGRNGARDVEKFVEYLGGELAETEGEITADNVAELAERMEECLVYRGGCRVYRPEAEYLLLNDAARAYLVNAKGKRRKK